jgi:hypothetical protein
MLHSPTRLIRPVNGGQSATSPPRLDYSSQLLRPGGTVTWPRKQKQQQEENKREIRMNVAADDDDAMNDETHAQSTS